MKKTIKQLEDELSVTQFTKELMTKYINLIIAGLVYFVPPFVIYYYNGNSDFSIMMMILWLMFGWVISSGILMYLKY